MGDVSRWLFLEKPSILAEWEERKHASLRPEGDSGGRGYTDPEIIPLCDALNETEGVVTLQSCCGHAYANGRFDHGNLWLWLSPSMAFEFYRFVHRLTAHQHPNGPIRDVSILWGRNGQQEIVSISFDGANEGKLEQSADIILAFFRSLRPRAPTPLDREELERRVRYAERTAGEFALPCPGCGTRISDTDGASAVCDYCYDLTPEQMEAARRLSKRLEEET